MVKKNEKNATLLKVSNPNTVWKLGTLLGEGSFGQATNSNNDVRAAKICKIDEQETFAATKIEVEILTLCQHENILKAFDSYYWDKKIWMIMELCSGGAIEGILDCLDGVDEPTARIILFQCLSGLEYLHANGYMHRDIKAGNLMLTERGVIKIADFGITAILSEPYGTAQTYIGTPYWMAPEVILTETQQGKYNCKCDVYSVGITAIELVQGMPPDHDLAPPQVMVYRLRADSPTLLNPSRWSSAYVDFVKTSLFKEASKRPTCLQCLEMDLFKKNDVRNGDLLLELYNIHQALKAGDVNDEEILDEDARTEDTSSLEVDLPVQTSVGFDSDSGKKPTKTIMRTIKYNVNGVQKSKSVCKKADLTRRDESDEFKGLRDKILHQQRALKAEEAREIKRLEASQKQQLDDIQTRHKNEYEVLLDRYRNDCDGYQKAMIKELEKRKTAVRAEFEKIVKKNRAAMDKERKMVNTALKSKNHSKYDQALFDKDYINNKLQELVESATSYIDAQNARISEYYQALVIEMNDKLKESLHFLIYTKLFQVLEIAQLRRSHICAKLEQILQQRSKSDLKELNITLKFMNAKREQLIRDHAKIRREFPKSDRILLKKELEAYKSVLRQERSKSERELLAKKQKEILEWLAIENEATVERQRNELEEFDRANDAQIREIQEYQEQKSALLMKYHQDLLHARYEEDEGDMKGELLAMYIIKKNRDTDFENELRISKAYVVDGLPNISPGLF